MVKVLDFGLAKAGGGDAIDDATSTHSPTAIGADDAGRAARHRRLHEPGAGARQGGRQAHRHLGVRLRALRDAHRPPRVSAARRSTDTIAKILEREPDWSRAAGGDARRGPRGSCARCLEKDPKRRLRDIGDARVELEEATPRRPMAAAGAARASLGLAAALGDRRDRLAAAAPRCWRLARARRRCARAPAQFTFAAPEGERFELERASCRRRRTARGSRSSRPAPRAQRALWIRRSTRHAPQPLAGTEERRGPILVARRPVHRVFRGRQAEEDRSSGGAVVEHLRRFRGQSGRDVGQGQRHCPRAGQPDGSASRACRRRDAEPITTLNAERSENSHRWPHFLPDGRHFLFTARSDVKENNLIYVGSLDSKDITPLSPRNRTRSMSRRAICLRARRHADGATLRRAKLSLVGEAFRRLPSTWPRHRQFVGRVWRVARRHRAGVSDCRPRDAGSPGSIARGNQSDRSVPTGTSARSSSRRTGNRRPSSSPIPTAATATSG